MAQSERVFRDTLCESRSYPVETTDPSGAKMIDELRRQVKEFRTVLEGEKVKYRQLVRDHEKRLQQNREDEAIRLDTALEACAVRKDQEKANEIKKFTESYNKQKELELRYLTKEKGDEQNRSFRKWQLEKNEAVRIAVETERRQSLEDPQTSFHEEELLAREAKLTREVFMLGEQNESLEQQIKNLSRLSRAQIDQMRRMKQECELRVEGIIRQHKTEASREMAQLRLAEQIIAEKDHDLHTVEYRADQAMIEKEALEEEIATMRSIHNMSNTSFQEGSHTRSMGGGPLQRRVDELDVLVKKLDEEKGNLKQDNAALRKKLLHDDGEKKGGSKVGGDKVKLLRKKNSELTSFNKELDDKVKALKAENDQLQKAKSSGPGETEQNVRKNLARQHAKDISEYTKQIHAKDRELTQLKKKVGKLEATAIAYSEPTPELEKKVKSMSIEKLHMEKLITKLYSRLPDLDCPEDLSRKELVVESNRMKELISENETLQSQIQKLQSSPRTGKVEEMDRSEVTPPSLLPERKEVHQEADRFKDLAQSASKLESECLSLKQTVEQLEAANSSLEQNRHEMRQQLKISTLAVKELEGSHDLTSGLETEVQDLKKKVRLKDNEVIALKEESLETAAQLSGKQVIITMLQKQMEELESSVRERDRECSRLQTALDEIRAKPSVLTTDVGIQFHKSGDNRSSQTVSQSKSTVSPPVVVVSGKPETAGKRFIEEERIRSPVHRNTRSRSPRTSPDDLLDSSLDNEMRAVGIVVNDSFDSSAGVSFSDPNLDVSVAESDQASLVVKEDADELPQKRPGVGAPRTAWEEGPGTDPAQATNGDGYREEHSRSDGESRAVDGQELLINLIKGVRNSEVGMVEEIIGSRHHSNGSGGEHGASPSKDSDESRTSQSENDKVCIYIAKYSYNPAEMSPNPTFDLELPLTAGDYLCVYGDMDDDGFYHGQLMTGESGMVPSNFIEQVADEDEVDGSQSLRKQHKGHSSLQDIVEVDEDTSSGGVGLIPPPCGLTLERQFVEGEDYSVALHWMVPHPLPEGMTGYSVYVNGEYNCDVSGADQTNVLLTGIPRKQLVKISVRTTTEEGESPDPHKLVILNPQYPEAPTNVKVSKSLSPRCLMVHWVPSKPLKEGNPIDSYAVYLNSHCCIQLGSSPTSAKTVCGQLLASDVKDFRDSLLKNEVVSLSVCSVSGTYMSAPSLPIVIPKEDFVYVLDSGKMTADESEITSSATSLSSIEDEEEEEGEEEKELYSPAKRLLDEVEIVTVDNVNVSNGVPSSPPPANGKVLQPDGPVKYYRALARYDPQLQSPNEDLVDEELAFFEDNVIIGITDIDEDGYLMGELNGKTGYVPSNLIEEVTDQEELSKIQTILQDQAIQRQDAAHLQNVNGRKHKLTEEDSPQKMKAVFDYDPALDSPNENSEVELALNEGDIVTVFGKPDTDGFFKAEVAGKKGLVPSNFLEEMTPPGENEIEVFAADVNSMKIADAIIQQRVVEAGDSYSKSLQTQNSQSGTSSKRKGGLLSRGKNLLTKGLGKKGD